MATSKNNIVTEGFGGKLGNIIFRTLRGKTVISYRPRKPRRQSETQRANRARFRNATAFAHGAMKDPEKKAYYWAKARKLKLPNAYTAAITDYMRRPFVNKVDTVKHHRNGHNNLIITAGKKEFALASVEVKLVDKEGMSLACSTATLKKPGKNEWVCLLPALPVLPAGASAEEGVASTSEPLSPSVAAVIITAKDQAGNISRVRHWQEQRMLEAA